MNYLHALNIRFPSGNLHGSKNVELATNGNDVILILLGKTHLRPFQKTDIKDNHLRCYG